MLFRAPRSTRLQEDDKEKEKKVGEGSSKRKNGKCAQWRIMYGTETLDSRYQHCSMSCVTACLS